CRDQRPDHHLPPLLIWLVRKDAADRQRDRLIQRGLGVSRAPFVVLVLGHHRQPCQSIFTKLRQGSEPGPVLKPLPPPAPFDLVALKSTAAGAAGAGLGGAGGTLATSPFGEVGLGRSATTLLATVRFRTVVAPGTASAASSSATLA